MIFQAGVVSKWTNDSQRFLLEHFDTIKNSPSHIYHSALPFSPSSSWLYKCYSTDPSLTVKVVKGLPAKWGMCYRIVLIDSYIGCLSCWNNIVTLGSETGDIIILDAITGSQTNVLSGHTGTVLCLTFSSDGTSLVSGSGDMTVKLWDMQTGGAVKTFSGHTDSVRSVSISADCTTIASGSTDETIYLWNIQRVECYHIIKQQDTVTCVTFSPTNPQHLISICDNKLWEWDTNGHQIKPPFNGSGITFSSDGTQFVSCSGLAVTVQSSDSRAIVAKFQTKLMHGGCCFSPNDRLIATTDLFTIYVWDITGSNPHLIKSIDNTGFSPSLVFSSPSTLISVSQGEPVKFWQIGALSADPVVTDPKSAPIPSPLISSISLQTRDGVAILSDIDGVKTQDIPASLCKSLSKILTKDYKYGDTKLINSKLVFVWYADKKINIWDPENEKFLLQAEAGIRVGDSMLDFRISGDGSRIFCINNNSILAWDLWTGEAIGRVEGFSYGLRLLAMKGSRVWAETLFTIPHKIRGWDFRIPGSSPIELSTIPPNILHSYGTKLWDNSLYRIQDTATGKVLLQLPKRFQSHIVEMQWNGQYLAISFRSKEELILEFHPTFLQ